MALQLPETGGVMGAFQAGRGLAGENPLGLLVRRVMDTVTGLQGMQLAHQAQLGQISAKAKAKFQYDPEAQFKQKLFDLLTPQIQSGTIDASQLARHTLGLPKTSEEMALESEAQAVGKGRAPLSPQEIEQTRLVKMQTAEHAANIAQKLKPRKLFGLMPQPPTPADVAAVQSQYGGQADDPIVDESGVELETGRRVGRTKSGRQVYLP